jgi:hypothetical protein
MARAKAAASHSGEARMRSPNVARNATVLYIFSL